MIRIYKSLRAKKLAQQLVAGEVGVIPTDTLYGLVGSALNESTVERIYQLRRRDFKKPLIVLVSSVRDLKRFGVRPQPQIDKLLRRYWPGAVSMVLPCKGKKFAYLHRGGETLAFRIPELPALVKLLKITGPLVAPSANWAGEPPAETIRAAQKYFSGGVDFYVDAGKLSGKPSTVVGFDKKGGVEVLRQGSVRIRE